MTGLDAFRDEKNYHARKSNDIQRLATVVGFALIWFFRTEASDGTFYFPLLLLAAALLLMLSLIFDLFDHYFRAHQLDAVISRLAEFDQQKGGEGGVKTRDIEQAWAEYEKQINKILSMKNLKFAAFILGYFVILNYIVLKMFAL